MTPTEQDKELREVITKIVEAEYRTPNYIPAVERIDHIIQLIIADRKRVALEARLDELEALEPMLNYMGDQVKVNKRIAELKAQQEEQQCPTITKVFVANTVRWRKYEQAGQR